jgi:hypothetical protein
MRQNCCEPPHRLLALSTATGFIVMCVAAISTCTANADCVSPNVCIGTSCGTGLVAYYKLDETSGTTGLEERMAFPEVLLEKGDMYFVL